MIDWGMYRTSKPWVGGSNPSWITTDSKGHCADSVRFYIFPELQKTAPFAGKHAGKGGFVYFRFRYRAWASLMTRDAAPLSGAVTVACTPYGKKPFTLLCPIGRPLMTGLPDKMP